MGLKLPADSRYVSRKTPARRSACSYTNEQLERSNRDIRRLPAAINHTGRGGRWLMFPSVRANFDPLPFHRPFSHSLSPVFFESPFFEFHRRFPIEIAPQNCRLIIAERLIYYYPSFRSFAFAISILDPRETPHILWFHGRLSFTKKKKKLYRTRACCVENILLNIKFRWRAPFDKIHHLVFIVHDSK